MFTKKQIIFLELLLMVGLAIAIKLFLIDYMINYSGEVYKSFCNINQVFNCDAVASSSYSQIFGIPIALIGMVGNFFLIIFLPIGMRLEHIRDRLKHIYLTIFAGYTIGCLLLIYVSIVYSPSFCIMCILFWVTSILTFIYLLVVSFGIIKNFMQFLKDLFYALLKHYAVVLMGLTLFASINIYIGKYYLPGLTCKNKADNLTHLDEGVFCKRNNAKMEVFIYTDFQCPWCRLVHEHVVLMAKKYRDEVQFTRKEFPIDSNCNRLVKRPFHPLACLAASYAKCAGEQGKYGEFHDLVYKNQAELSEDKLVSIAEMLFLDIDKMQLCVNNKEIKGKIKNEIEEAIAYDINATPSFRIYAEITTDEEIEEKLSNYLAKYPYIEIEKIKEIYDKGLISNLQIIDIRNDEDFNKFHFIGSINFKIEDFINQEKLPVDISKPILLIGNKKENLKKLLNVINGYGATSILILDDNFEKWKKQYGNLNIKIKNLSQ